VPFGGVKKHGGRAVKPAPSFFAALFAAFLVVFTVIFLRESSVMKVYFAMFVTANDMEANADDPARGFDFVSDKLNAYPYPYATRAGAEGAIHSDLSDWVDEANDEAEELGEPVVSVGSILPRPSESHADATEWVLDGDVIAWSRIIEVEVRGT
jgi:hypothetical protein